MNGQDDIWEYWHSNAYYRSARCSDRLSLLQYNQATLLRHTDLSKEHPQSDYTPPSFITLLFSDLGILTPSAVSDELIRLYL